MSETVSSMTPAEAREAFVGWQCRVRQHAMRNDTGRPSIGMTPRVLTEDGTVILDRMITLIVPLQPFESTTFFKHQVRKTHDSREILEKGLAFLQATHFQVSTGFRDEVTAVFPPGSEIATAMLKVPVCVLEYAQFNQEFRMSCRIRALAEDSGIYQATLWHNRLFNPQLPDGVTILGFQPDWETAEISTPG